MKAPIPIALSGIAVFVAVAALWFAASRDGQRVAVIDNERVFTEYAGKAAYEQRLKALEQAHRNDLDSLRIQIEAVQRQAEAGDDAPSQEVNILLRELRLRTDRYQQEFRKTAGQYDELIWKEISDKVNDFSHQQGIDILIGKSHIEDVFLSDTSLNVTREAIRFINRQNRSQP